MENQKIKNIISELENFENLDEAYLGFFYENDEYASITANKKGIIKFSSNLLKTLNEFDYHLSKENHYSVIPLKRLEWIDNNSHIFFKHINPKIGTKEDLLKESNAPEPSTNSIKQKFAEILFFLTLIFLIVSVVVGAFTFIKFIFNLFY